jgi:cyclophilin family peptidyl-prolyl cis-trans isomerase
MANSGPDTNSSQFFITTGSPRFLDFKHTIFGQLVSGQQILTDIAHVPRNSSDVPLVAVTINSASLSNTNPNGVIHIDTTQAQAGETANVTVTAHQGATSTSQSFQLTVAANDDSSGTPIIERPYLLPLANQVVGANQTAIFQAQGVAPTPGDVLTYQIEGGVNTTTSTFTPVDSTLVSSATVDANGVVRVVPKAGLAAGTVIPLLIAVRDQTDRSAGGGLNSTSNFDWHQITLTVTGGAAVNLPPIAIAGTQTVTANQTSTVQLQGDAANTGQTLTFALLSQPTHGTLSNFNAQTGTFSYTPNPNFLGKDSVQFQVTDVGPPTPNLTSNPATFTINVGGGTTNAVRVIGRVLVVTPPPRTDGGTNVIALTESNNQILISVNNNIDATQPTVSSLDSIVVFGSKANDDISISPAITLPATLDGGHGGTNFVQAGGGQTREHGWFGLTTLIGGPQNDELIGRAGRVHFKPSGGNDVLYAGVVEKRTGLHGVHFPGIPPKKSTRRREGLPPKGTFFKFVNNHLVAVPSPKPKLISQAGGSTGTG